MILRTIERAIVVLILAMAVAAALLAARDALGAAAAALTDRSAAAAAAALDNPAAIPPPEPWAWSCQRAFVYGYDAQSRMPGAEAWAVAEEAAAWCWSDQPTVRTAAALGHAGYVIAPDGVWDLTVP
jgi:hypothetical protein